MQCRAYQGQYIELVFKAAKLILAARQDEEGRGVSECRCALQGQSGSTQVSYQHGCRGFVIWGDQRWPLSACLLTLYASCSGDAEPHGIFRRATLPSRACSPPHIRSVCITSDYITLLQWITDHSLIYMVRYPRLVVSKCTCWI